MRTFLVRLTWLSVLTIGLCIWASQAEAASPPTTYAVAGNVDYPVRSAADGLVACVRVRRPGGCVRPASLLLSRASAARAQVISSVPEPNPGCSTQYRSALVTAYSNARRLAFSEKYSRDLVILYYRIYRQGARYSELLATICLR